MGHLLSAATTLPEATNPVLTYTYRYDGNPNPANSNASGRLTHIGDPTGSTDWSYDSEGRLQNKTQTTAGQNYSMDYSYYPDTGLLKTQTYPSGIVIQYSYDSAGRPDSVRTGDLHHHV